MMLLMMAGFVILIVLAVILPIMQMNSWRRPVHKEVFRVSKVNHEKMQRAQGGFTLLEIMVVVAIIGLLAAMIVPNVIGQGEQAKVDIAKTNVSRIVQRHVP